MTDLKLLDFYKKFPDLFILKLNTVSSSAKPHDYVVLWYDYQNSVNNSIGTLIKKDILLMDENCDKLYKSLFYYSFFCYHKTGLDWNNIIYLRNEVRFIFRKDTIVKATVYAY